MNMLYFQSYNETSRVASIFIMWLSLCLLASLSTIATADSVSKSPVAAKIDTLVVGVFPRRGVRKTLESFLPLMQHLERELKLSVTLDVAEDYYAFEQRLYQGKYDLVHLNQTQYIKAHKALGYEVIAQNEEFDEKTIRAAIYTRIDSGIQTIEELRGKIIAFGGNRDAMISYVVPTYMLMEAGLSSGDYTEKFVNNPPSALMSAIIGRTDAAGTGDIVIKLPMIKKSVDPKKMRVLALSEPLVHLPWAVGARVDGELRGRIQSLLTGLVQSDEGRNILKSAHLTGINPAEDSDYARHREILKRVSKK
jgi:phosphonate transport system substrate-binding protein